MNTQVKLFDANNKLVPNFNEEIEKILISVHGEKYYDVDEELVNTNEIAIIQDEINTEIKKQPKEKKKEKVKKKGKVGVQDFVPVLFFLLIFIVIVMAGYYFLNTVDLMNLIGANN